jgi:hypothetical protein
MPAEPLPVALIADEACKKHDSGVGHPEAIARFDAVLDGLSERGLLDRLLRLPP